jgi:uncharacterized protein YkwD
MLSTILALAMLSQSPTVTDTPPPQWWQAPDATGKVWYSTDRSALAVRVDAINAELAKSSPATVQTPSVQGDAYGFGSWLNAERARRGLHGLAHDPALTQDAAYNSSRVDPGAGFRATAHNWMGRARRQNAGVGHGPDVWVRWTTSPGHADALFDRSVTCYGIALVGSVWTFTAY